MPQYRDGGSGGRRLGKPSMVSLLRGLQRRRQRAEPRGLGQTRDADDLILAYARPDLRLRRARGARAILGRRGALAFAQPARNFDYRRADLFGGSRWASR